MNRWVFGILLIIFGVVGVLNSFDIVDISIGMLFREFWPVLLIIWGLSIIITARGYFSGGIIAVLGLLFLGQNLNLYVIDYAMFWSVFWPVVIILIGLKIALAHNVGESKAAIMGSLERKSSPWKLESGSYQAIMGGIELDLRQAEIAEKVTTLNLTAIMGGIDIIVPDNIAVICQGTAILGGLELPGKESGGIVSSLQAEAGNPAEAEKVLKINCTVLLGGIEIKRQENSRAI